MNATSERNLSTLIALVKRTKNKALSELSSQEKHAVAFFCNVYPLELVNGKLKYNRNAKQTGLSVSYVWANSIVKSCKNLTQTGFTANSAHIYFDEPLPEFKEASVSECLEEYPETLLVPTHQSTGYEHLPRISKETKEPVKSNNISFTIASIFQEIALYSRFRKEERPEYIDFIMNEINHDKLLYLELVGKLETVLPGLSQGIELYDTDVIFKRINYDETKHDLPIKNKLGIVMIWAKQGIYLNSRSIK